MLAAASIGAAFSSCSQEFGVPAVLERFGRLAPRVLLAADGYYWRGRPVDRMTELQEIRKGLPGLRTTVMAPNLGGVGDLPRDAGIVPYDDLGKPGSSLTTNSSPSTTPFTWCFPPARPERPSASCIVPAVRCFSM